MRRKYREALLIVGLVSLGVVIGMVLSWFLFLVSVDSLINNILPNIHIEEVSLNINETALVEAMNSTFMEN